MYIIFAGQEHYPRGGMNDLKDGVGPFKSADAALRAIADMGDIDWWQIARITDDELFIVDSGQRM